ncbi:phosphotransferase enzyme family protein [Paenibacillus glycinis]|uniref:Phosphotransferase n=1 Tax=Paenibacillus glycinis TaxID=2697035 RepID=A0ABW9XP28_9BACL|nr:phosphotransferase [Paenibacillus glycinis]NBD24388.1 phosphotransferase [Paenibacillus glycinis]
MMKLTNMLRGLQDDRPARKLMTRWEHDEGSLRYWRASSNFVYAFACEGRSRFLRFIHASDHSKPQIEAELDYVRYLAANGYPVAAPVMSADGQWIETIEDDTGGNYYGVAFEEAEGVHVPLDRMTDAHCASWGRSLARLHELSARYVPDADSPVRWSWRDVLDWTRGVLERHPEEEAALLECDRVQAWLETLPQDGRLAGLIHFDFQPDNVFDRGGEAGFSAIDFDDAMMHWYAAARRWATSRISRRPSQSGSCAPSSPATSRFGRSMRTRNRRLRSFGASTDFTLSRESCAAWRGWTNRPPRNGCPSC